MKFVDEAKIEVFAGKGGNGQEKRRSRFFGGSNTSEESK